MINRRKLLQCTVGASTALLLGARPVLAQSPRAQVGNRGTIQSLNPNLALVTGNGGNILVRKAGNGELLAVDGGLAESATPLLQLISGALGNGKVTTLINTHWHHEQTGLNEELAGKARIFAHENTRQWLSTRIERPWEDLVFEPLSPAAQPNETFYNYGSLQHGDVSVDYGYMRQAHTDGDMYVFFPQDNVLHTGGIVSSDQWPLMDWWTGGWIGGLVDGIETLLSVANDATVIVPATGPVITKADLMQLRDIYAELFNSVRESFMAANSVPETLALKLAAAYEPRFGNSDMFIELSQWSLIPHYAPDA